MRREELYLADILEAADAIRGFLEEIGPDEFFVNDLVRSAVLQKLLIIGEAAARLPKNFRDRHSGVPWTDIVAFRNIAIHAYFSVSWPMVAATKDVPELRQVVAEVLASEYPEHL